MTAVFPRRQVFSQFSTIGTEFTHKHTYAHYFGLPSGVGLLKLSSLRYSHPVSQFYWVYSPPQWLSPNPGSPSLGRGPAKPALSSCGGGWGVGVTETLQPRGHPLQSIQFLCGMCLKIQMCVYSQDEQPTGLFGESQQDEQTNYEVKEQQQHIRQPPTTHTHTHILLCVNYNINPCLTATWPKF